MAYSLLSSFISGRWYGRRSQAKTARLESMVWQVDRGTLFLLIIDYTTYKNYISYKYTKNYKYNILLQKKVLYYSIVDVDT